MIGTLVPSPIVGTGIEGFRRVDKDKTKQIRVDPDIAVLVNRVAAMQDPPVSAPEYLSALLRPLLKKELARAMARQQKALSEDE